MPKWHRVQSVEGLDLGSLDRGLPTIQKINAWEIIGMNANWRRSQEKLRLPRVAMEKYKIRSSVQDDVTEYIYKEMTAYGTVVDATMLMALHRRYHLTAPKLREIFEDMIRTRVEYRNFFRGDDYVLQETGKNIEDTAILHDLMAIGVDLKSWEDGIEYDAVTGEVTFGG